MNVLSHYQHFVNNFYPLSARGFFPKFPHYLDKSVRIPLGHVFEMTWEDNDLCWSIICSEKGAQWLSGRVLERDRGAAGSSLTVVTVLCPWARAFILAYYWFNPGKPVPHNWKIVEWTLRIKTNKNLFWEVSWPLDLIAYLITIFRIS